MQLTLTSDDQELFNRIATVQNCIGPDSPDLLSFVSSLRQCLLQGSWYDKATNPAVKQYMDSICKALIPVATNFGTNFPGLFVAYDYGQACNALYGTQYIYGGFFAHILDNFSGPPEWMDAFANAIPGLATGNLPDGQLIWQANDDGAPGVAIADYESAFFDPAKWTTYKDAATALAPVFAAQASDLKALHSQVLDGQASLYLLHLLIALCNTPDPDERDLVYTTTSLPGHPITDPADPTDPQPKAQFIDRLVYLAMLTWNDPDGSFVWSHDQISAYLAELAPALRNQDPGSSAIAKVLAHQANVLKTFASYPGDDPEAPTLGFTQRRTKTLEKLNDLWTAYTPPSR